MQNASRFWMRSSLNTLEGNAELSHKVGKNLMNKITTKGTLGEKKNWLFKPHIFSTLKKKHFCTFKKEINVNRANFSARRQLDRLSTGRKPDGLLSSKEPDGILPGKDCAALSAYKDPKNF